jgi:hypothetical protein
MLKIMAIPKDTLIAASSTGRNTGNSVDCGGDYFEGDRNQ